PCPSCSQDARNGETKLYHIGGGGIPSRRPFCPRIIGPARDGACDTRHSEMTIADVVGRPAGRRLVVGWVEGVHRTLVRCTRDTHHGPRVGPRLPLRAAEG